MARRSITEEAKQLVLAKGPSIVLEFTHEIVRDTIDGIVGLREAGYYSANDLPDPGLTDGDFAALADEVRKQAGRVYSLLGYINPVTGK